MSRWTPAAGQVPEEREPWCDPSVVLGSSGPFRVFTEDDDPDFEPPPFLGFTHVVWWKPETREVVAVGELGEVIRPDPVARWLIPLPMPDMWDGDQA